MYSSDHPEQIKITISEADVELARQKAEAYAASKKISSNSKASVVAGLDVWNNGNAAPSKSQSISQSINQEMDRSSRMVAAKSVARRRFWENRLNIIVVFFFRNCIFIDRQMAAVTWTFFFSLLRQYPSFTLSLEMLQCIRPL